MIAKWSVLTIIVWSSFSLVDGHGRLIEPPSRATMWRYGFNTPPDYNDHELYCGGFARQWNKNGGKCGICGDAWDIPRPRPHEAGGKYAQGVIVRRYRTNSVITIRVELTANHRGYFEFRLCPNNSPKKDGSQECLDRYILQRSKPTGKNSANADEQQHEYRYYPGPGSKVFEMRYSLPKDLTCTQCILQWRYIAGNNWGTCENGTGAVGCGPQEEFRACSDVAIVDAQGEADETPYDGDNELPTDHDEDKVADETTYTAADKVSAWWFPFIIVICSFVGVCGLFALIYFYYYHARETLKNWLSGQWLCKEKPVPPPRTKKQFDSTSQENTLTKNQESV